MIDDPSLDPWEFDYAPIPSGGGDEGQPERDLVLATTEDVDSAKIVEILAGVVPDVSVTPLYSGYPIFWTRIESSRPIDRTALLRSLAASGTCVRYLASATQGNQRLPPPIDWSFARPRRCAEWKARTPSSSDEPETPWRWFLRQEGANVRRLACGTGAGTRLAIIDNDGRDLERIDLDAEILVGVERIPRAASHAALLLGWSVGARKDCGSRFRGIAPDASPRFYCIPKHSKDIVSLPLAIVRAVDDGADVLVCATYVEGLTSQLLDDALEFATRLGRNGKGTAVVFPTGREMSSPQDSIHSSLSLGMAEPASDPRVFCAGPSARDGGWFLWRDRHGKRRPFANRGPAVRWLAPGDDMANPFSDDDRPGHAESSGASSIAAGVLLLTIASNPDLSLAELDSLLATTSVPVDAARQAAEPGLANRRDLLPLAVDADGHNAKHGYGRLDATAACLSASDPIALTLVRIGEHDAALHYINALAKELPSVYGKTLARWAVKVMLRDAGLAHGFATALRGLRLSCRHPDRALNQPPGHLLRHVALMIRALLGSEPNLVAAQELRELDGIVRAAMGSADGDRRFLDVVGRSTGWMHPPAIESTARSVVPEPSPSSRRRLVALPTSSADVRLSNSRS